MGRISTAFRAFFGSLFSKSTAENVKRALTFPAPSQPVPLPVPVADSPSKKPAAVPVSQKPRQSEAITLLATLQREARFIDFLKEDLSGYSDEQVGAAVREIHRDSRSVINRLFAIQPIMKDSEGASVDIPAGFDATRYRLTGQLTGTAPFRGTLRHHGWEATQCELPAYTGGESAATTIAPAEVEVGSAV